MIVMAHKQELFTKARRTQIWKQKDLMVYNCVVSINPEPYRVALFWLDIADKTWGWRAS